VRFLRATRPERRLPRDSDTSDTVKQSRAGYWEPAASHRWPVGLSDYARRFVENGIGLAALLYLTDQDLKDNCVLLGLRRKMLARPSLKFRRP
jgi:hypothetical protein